ncbi:MAG: UDP-N-acetylmuramate dehydrogenase [Deltaproteobacteria bacterium]|nr:UDP-N-acetylmuramate dehydrogenase [Deltaproteobacteria bacterium]
MAYDGEFMKEIDGLISGKIRRNESMARHTSMGVGGPADLFIEPESVDEVRKVINCLFEYAIPFIPVGNCTNLIVRDGGYRGAVVSLRRLEAMTVERKGEGNGFIYGEAGVSLSRIVERATRESLTGMEFCAGIPGSIGGAVRMNAGAYGSELKDVISEVGFIDENGMMNTKHRADLTFEYRNLVMKEGSIIVSAVFHLKKGRDEEIRRRVGEIISMRKSKHPMGYGNAGSVFKNPKDIPAGRIIDEVGLKGMRIGGAQVSEQHGNFIVNLGDATCMDILHLIEVITARVEKETGIVLEPEIKIIGDL